jgi:hypothetical protein
MSFSRRLTVALHEDPPTYIKPNQVLIQDQLYNRLLDITDGGLIFLKITSDDNLNTTLQYVTVVGGHTNYQAQILMSQVLMDSLGGAGQYRFTKCKALPELTSISVKIHSNEFCFADPRVSIQLYLEDYHILYKDFRTDIPTDVEGMTATISIEDIEPGPICRVPNGEVTFDLIMNEPEPLEPAATLPTVAAPAFGAPAPATPPLSVNTPYNFETMKRSLFPDLVSTDAKTPEPTPDPIVLSKEELRRRRLAALGGQHAPLNPLQLMKINHPH